MGKVTVNDDGCWIWLGARFWTGYRRIGFEGKSRLVHRVAYVAWKGSIPEGLQIDHLCGILACCNPDHLEAVTARENVLRSSAPEVMRRRWEAYSVCVNGHEYTPENTKRNKLGARLCVICSREQGRRRQSEYRSRKRVV